MMMLPGMASGQSSQQEHLLQLPILATLPLLAGLLPSRGLTTYTAANRMGRLATSRPRLLVILLPPVLSMRSRV
jgi:hypothetical protein